MTLKICIIIPVFNEAENIADVVSRAVEKGFDVVVINDGSADDSGRIAEENGAVVLTNDKRMGKGMSLRIGFEYACKQGFDGVIAMDGDGQHDTEDIGSFLKAIDHSPKSIVTGNRMHDAFKMPWLRRMTNKLMSYFISVICKQSIPDTQCGYRYIPCEVLEKIGLRSNDYEIESEVLIQAARQGYTITSVPIKTIYRGEKSSINPIRDTFRFFIYIVKELCASKPKRR